MPEFSHHYGWIQQTQELLERIDRGAAVDAQIRTALEQGRVVCEQILNQNPTSMLANGTMRRIDALLQGNAPHVPEEEVFLTEPETRERQRQNYARSLGLQADALLPQTLQEQSVEQGITAFEKKFLQYGKDVLQPKVDTLPAEKLGLKNALSFPMQAVQHNRNHNPLRNAAVTERVARSVGLEPPALLLSMPTPNHFAYHQLMGGQDDMNIAGFAPLHRTMMFSPSMNFESHADMMVVLHECLHIPQHAKRRQADILWYTRFFGNGRTPTTIVNDEYQAYGLELEAMDLITDGMIRGGAGKDELMHALGARENQWMMVEMLRLFGEQYMQGGDAARNVYPENYKTLIKRMCLHDGYEVFEAVQGNKLQRVLRA